MGHVCCWRQARIGRGIAGRNDGQHPRSKEVPLQAKDTATKTSLGGGAPGELPLKLPNLTP